MVDRASRFVVAHTSGPRDATLAERTVRQVQARSGGHPLAWCSDGWRSYPQVLRRAYRRPVRTGKRGRPPLRLPEGIGLTQTVKHRDARGHLRRVETRVAFGPSVAQPATVYVERRNGVCRDRLAALTRKTHAFAKTAATWDALLGLHVFERNWLCPHLALREPEAAGGRRYRRRCPAMALGLTDHVWSWQEFFTTSVHVSP